MGNSTLRRPVGDGRSEEFDGLLAGHAPVRENIGRIVSRSKSAMDTREEFVHTLERRLDGVAGAARRARGIEKGRGVVR